jgi:MSHA pilin protein MshC
LSNITEAKGGRDYFRLPFFAMKSRGFTLIELIMVIVLLGILAVFVAPRLPSVTGTNAAAFADKLKADIRYAQNLAMTQNRRARVYFNGFAGPPGPGYAAAIDNSATGNCTSFSPIADPAGGGNLSIALNIGDYAGITVNPDVDCLEYNSLGRPYDCSEPPPNCSGASLAGDMTIWILPAGSVTITAQTGAVN